MLDCPILINANNVECLMKIKHTKPFKERSPLMRSNSGGENCSPERPKKYEIVLCRLVKALPDSVDEQIFEQLSVNANGSKIKPLVKATGKSEGAIRYRLLTLEARGLVKASRERGSTTYFLSDIEEEPG
jgi:DNA-binding transcriptional ArsR family regulator